MYAPLLILHIAGIYYHNKLNLHLTECHQYNRVSIMCSNAKTILAVLDLTGDLISIMCILNCIRSME